MSNDNLDVTYNDLELYKNRYYNGNAVLYYIQRYIRAVFTLDLRALGLLRIGMASLVLLDLSIRATDLEAHYSNEGVLPLGLLFQHAWGPYTVSIHTLSGLWQVQALLFLLEGMFALLMLLGWHTRLASGVVWFMHLSLQARNPYVLQGGDDLLRMMLFWGLFLPWGKRYSLDGNRPENKDSNTYFGMAGAAYLVQICFLYIFTALLKDSPEWRTEGTALYYALSLDQMVFPLGKFLYQYPHLLKYLTLSVFYLELFSPLLFFMPFWTTGFRILGFTMIVMLHLGIGLTLFVGLFFMIGIASVLGLFPYRWMDWFDAHSQRLQLFIASAMERLRSFTGRIIRVNVSVSMPALNSSWVEILRNSFIGFCLVFILFWNLQNIGLLEGTTERANWFGRTLRLDQNWGMFAPTVFKDDGWYILEATTESGDCIDLNRGGRSVTYEKPESVVSLFKNDRWRKYSENYLFVCNSFMRPYYSNMVFNNWNAEHPDNQVRRLEVIYMKEVTRPSYQYVAPSREVLCVTEAKEDTDEPE